MGQWDQYPTPDYNLSRFIDPLPNHGAKNWEDVTTEWDAYKKKQREADIQDELEELFEGQEAEDVSLEALTPRIKSIYLKNADFDKAMKLEENMRKLKKERMEEAMSMAEKGQDAVSQKLWEEGGFKENYGEIDPVYIRKSNPASRKQAFNMGGGHLALVGPDGEVEDIATAASDFHNKVLDARASRGGGGRRASGEEKPKKQSDKDRLMEALGGGGESASNIKSKTLDKEKAEAEKKGLLQGTYDYIFGKRRFRLGKGSPAVTPTPTPTRKKVASAPTPTAKVIVVRKVR